MPDVPEALAWCPAEECGSGNVRCCDFSLLDVAPKRVWKMDLYCKECHMEWSVQCGDEAKNAFFERLERSEEEVARLERLFYASPDE